MNIHRIFYIISSSKWSCSYVELVVYYWRGPLYHRHTNVIRIWYVCMRRLKRRGVGHEVRHCFGTNFSVSRRRMHKNYKSYWNAVPSEESQEFRLLNPPYMEALSLLVFEIFDDKDTCTHVRIWAQEMSRIQNSLAIWCVLKHPSLIGQIRLICMIYAGHNLLKIKTNHIRMSAKMPPLHTTR